MPSIDFYCSGSYDSPLTPSGRGRTIAAFLITQGNSPSLSNVEMRRDILTSLMSPRAVDYWLNEQGWLEKTRKVGRVQLLRLTERGLVTCQNSLAGGGNVPTNPGLVADWVRRMQNGGQGAVKKTFAALKEI
jgi:hypothetical protein